MRFSARLQLLTCLVLYASCAHAIMVKFGTKDGPIEPPPPERQLPPVQPFRIPAPVWEERSNDTPDPNAQWRPQLFIPQPRYTQVVYSPKPLNNAQRFVNSYIPIRQPVQAQPIQPQAYFTPSQVLSSQSLPGFGLRYFLPTYNPDDKPKQVKQEDAKLNAIDANNLNDRRDSSNDLQWQFEKDLAKRNTRNTQEAAVPYVYQFPAHVSRHQ
ncbi:uncharacterized protein LOC134650067 [Cydia amplana]|uniref:uncharacterized protein LOC134650067 n=1 Tax=Cydia amplana TaxID=1869771 RepID=UPI002FE5B263